LQAKVKLWQENFVALDLAAGGKTVPPMAEHEVVRATEQGTWRVLGGRFRVDRSPLAAGRSRRSHRATFIGGDRVVRKAQQPTAREEVEPDLAFPKLFTASGAPGASKVIDMEAVFKHLSISLHRELDFNQKA